VIVEAWSICLGQQDVKIKKLSTLIRMVTNPTIKQRTIKNSLLYEI